ncbi:HEAT repeat domain-containing protein [Methanofollis fontis]|uniref:HEAT repeat domain-containing protein n=1 Tax=Methanofollis fontis TaxID=2052832 RepID=A0A483CZG3_9EURY|nr:HEAT repeat domain-containing protein [Methanofollis fontis]TAJ45762.1 hypothetical protein CUJ86_03375 [Methanofollis fontis]
MAKLELVQKRPDLEEMKAMHDVDGLMEVLRTHEEEGNRAALTLARLGTEALDPLIDALKSKNEAVQWKAAMAIGEMGSPAVETLISTIRSSERRVQLPALWALEQIGDELAVDFFIGILDHKSDYCRQLAAASLLKIGNERGEMAARKRLSQESESFRGIVAEMIEGS